MSKGLKPTIYIDENVVSSVGARNKAEESERDREKLKSKLLALALATPRDITPLDESPLSYVTETFNEIWEDLWDAFINDYVYTVIADDADYEEDSLVKKSFEEDIAEKKKYEDSIKIQRDFFEKYSEVLNKFNMDDFLIYEEWVNGRLEMPNPFTKEDRDKIVNHIKEKEKELLLKAIENGK